MHHHRKRHENINIQKCHSTLSILVFHNTSVSYEKSVRLVCIRPHRLNESSHRDDSKALQSMWEPVGSYREKEKNDFYQCSEFAAQLFSVFSIDISNDVPGTHPSSFYYSCKQVLERYL